jgi:hypothetical protein
MAMRTSPQVLGGRLVMKFLLSGLGLVLIAAWAAPAQAQTVNCPLATANRQITNPLPPEWRQTPFAQRLTGTRKTTSGVLQTLICEYGEAGNIERAAPDNTVCTARTGGFDCRPTVITKGVTPSVAVPVFDIYRSATVVLRSSAGAASLDLDTGGSSATGAELRNIFHDSRGWGYDYSRDGGAELWQHRGTTPLGKSGCTKSVDLFEVGRPPMYLPPAGQHVCYKTGAGRIGEFVVTAYGTAPGGVQTVSIKFTTWN